MKKNLFYLLVILSLFILIIPFSSKASDIKGGENIYVGKNETVSGNLYATAQNITIDGEIEGDLIALAQNITINGRLNGDLIAIAQNIMINGEINGNSRVGANNLSIKGLIARNLNFFGQNLSILEGAELRDVLAFSKNTNLGGKIMGNIDLFSENSEIKGYVAGNAKIRNNENAQIDIFPEAVIDGDLYYHESANFTRQDKSQITGLVYQLPAENNYSNNIFPWWQLLIYKIISAFIIALVIIRINKNYLPNLLNERYKKPWPKMFWGMIIFIFLPLVILSLAITLIGLPLALVLFGLYLSAFFVTKIVAAFLIGSEILQRSKLKNKRNVYLRLIIGLLILFSLTSIPFAGWLISLIISSFALGIILNKLKNK